MCCDAFSARSNSVSVRSGVLLALLLIASLVGACGGARMATLINSNSTQCLNFPAEGNPILGTPARIHQCDPFKNQTWNLADNQISASGGICLTVKDDATEDGSAVIYAPCDDAPGQHWSEDANGRIVGLGGKCLDVEGGYATDWAPLIITTCSDARTQKWRVQR
jgi:hypothetical protein